MCVCVDVPIGSYKSQVELERPSHMEGRTEGTRSDSICVDRCLEEEIKELWKAGIATTGCCCGHNTHPPYIGVVDEHIERMKSMGYKVHINPMRPDSEDSFIPKSI